MKHKMRTIITTDNKLLIVPVRETPFQPENTAEVETFLSKIAEENPYEPTEEALAEMEQEHLSWRKNHSVR